MHVNTLLEFQSIPIALSAFKAFVQIISRIGVPIFLMITGSLLLNRDYSDETISKKFFSSNWLSLFITAEIWYVIIYLYKSLSLESILRTNGVLPAIKQMVLNQLFINQDTFASMWYMTMILCVYLIIPFIAVGLQKIKTRFILLPLVIAYVSGFLIPDVNSVLSLVFNETGKEYIQFGLSITNLFSIYVVYIVIGYWLNLGGLTKLSHQGLIVGTVISLVCTAFFQFWAFTRPGNYIVKYNASGVLVSSILIFECFRRYGNKLHKIKKPITVLSTISFGIYFLHVCIIEGIQVILPKRLGYIPYFAILETGSFVGSIIIILLLRKYKRISRLLFRC